jgi:hypothetical protein
MRYITDLIQTKLQQNGREYHIFHDQEVLFESLNDVPRDGKVYGIVTYGQANRNEQIESHNINYSFNIEFLVPAHMTDQFRVDAELLKELEQSLTILDFTVKINIGVGPRATSQMIKGQYFQTFNLNGDVVEFSDLSIGDDIEIYFQTGANQWELVDIEQFLDNRQFRPDMRNMKNDSQQIEFVKGGYQGSNTSLSFGILLRPNKIFDQYIINLRHGYGKPNTFTFKFVYNPSAFSGLVSTTFIENFYITSINRTVSKKNINSVQLSFERGEVL